MENFENLVLCEFENENITINVWATLENGELTFSGQDLGPNVRKLLGKEEHEYWYSLNKKNTKKLLEVINGLDDPKSAIKREFSEEDGLRKMREVCEENNIKYEFFSHDSDN